MNDLEQKIKVLIIECLDLEDIAPDDIETESMLFGDGLGLDSIDALELGLGIYKTFDIKLDSNSEHNKEIFQSVASLAKFINSEKSKLG